MHLSRFLAIGAIVGVVRQARTRGVTPYHGFAAAYTAVLLVWHFPPNERFMLPLFPRLLASIGSEVAHLGRVIRSAWRQGAANRAVAAGMISVAATLAVIVSGHVGLGVTLIFREFPGIIGQHREVLASNRAAFAGIAQHTASGAFYAYDDPVFFYTPAIMPRAFESRPCPFIGKTARPSLVLFATSPPLRAQGLDYLFFTAADFHRDLPEAKCGGFCPGSRRWCASRHGDCPRYIA